MENATSRESQSNSSSSVSSIFLGGRTIDWFWLDVSASANSSYFTLDVSKLVQMGNGSDHLQFNGIESFYHRCCYEMVANKV